MRSQQSRYTFKVLGSLQQGLVVKESLLFQSAVSVASNLPPLLLSSVSFLPALLRPGSGRSGRPSLRRRSHLKLLQPEVRPPSSPARRASSPIDPRSPSPGLVSTSTTGSANPDPRASRAYNPEPQSGDCSGQRPWSRIEALQTLCAGEKKFQDSSCILG